MTFDVSEGRRLLAAATQGEWEYERHHVGYDMSAKGADEWFMTDAEFGNHADVDLIVWLHNHAADLLDAADTRSAIDAHANWLRLQRTTTELSAQAREAEAAHKANGVLHMEIDALRAEVERLRAERDTADRAAALDALGAEPADPLTEGFIRRDERVSETYEQIADLGGTKAIRVSSPGGTVARLCVDRRFYIVGSNAMLPNDAHGPWTVLARHEDGA